MLVITAYNSSS